MSGGSSSRTATIARMLCLICASTSAAGVDLEDGRAEALEEQVDELGEDGAFVLEVEVEGALGDLRGGDDVVDLRVVVALRGEDVARRSQQLLPPLRLVHLASAPFYHPCAAPRRGDRGRLAANPSRIRAPYEDLAQSCGTRTVRKLASRAGAGILAD